MTSAPITVSIIVPARNEADCIAACVASLAEQRLQGLEIIVVDDASTDGTASLAAAAAPQVRILQAGALAKGWLGKSAACFAGAEAARGEWLLFTDADTLHAPQALTTALSMADDSGAVMLSLSPRQIAASLPEKILMPAVFAELAIAFRPSEVSDPASPVAAANGQFLLIKRETYWRLGGHAAVAHELLEDVALARLVKGAGERIHFAYAGELVSARMYRTTQSMLDGWTKNLFLLFPHPAALLTLRTLEQTALVASLVLAARGSVWAGVLGAALAASVFLRLRRANFGVLDTVIAMAGTPVFLLLLLRSHLQARVVGEVRWKGRTYAVNATARAASASGAE